MRFFRFVLVGVCLTTLSLAGEVAESDALRNWRDIHLTVEYDISAKSRIVRARAFVAAPTEEVWRVVADFEHYVDLIPRCPLVMLLDPSYVRSLVDTIATPHNTEMTRNLLCESARNDTSYLYNEIDIIFPIGKVRTILELVADTATRTVSWRKVIGPMRIYRGEWRLQPCCEGTQVEFLTEFRLHIWMPPFIVRGAINYYFPKIICKLRERFSRVEGPLFAQEP